MMTGRISADGAYMVKLKLINRDGSSAGAVEVDAFYVAPDIIRIGKEYFVCTVLDRNTRDQMSRDQLEYQRAELVMDGSRTYDTI